MKEINQRKNVGKNSGGKQPTRPPPDYEKIWFPTPETCANPESLPPLQRKIFDNIAELQNCDSLNPMTNANDKETFLNPFNWSKLSLTKEQNSQMEELLVEYYDIFSKHRFFRCWI